jgi:hypothetical protein
MSKVFLVQTETAYLDREIQKQRGKIASATLVRLFVKGVR